MKILLYLASHTESSVWISHSFTLFSHLREVSSFFSIDPFWNLDWPQRKNRGEENGHEADGTDGVVKVEDVAVPLRGSVEFRDILNVKPEHKCQGKWQVLKNLSKHHLETNWVQMSGLRPLPNISLTP